MEVFGKAWGSTSTIFNNINVQVNRITGIKGGYSSKHKHISKYNLLWCESGRLKIKVWKNYKLIDETILGPQQSTIVKPGEYHCFEVLEDNTVAFEVYWVELQESDIVRKGHGGRKQI